MGLVDASLNASALNTSAFDNVTVTSSATGFSLSGSPTTVLFPSTPSASVTVLGTPGFSDTVNLSLTGLPIGATAVFGASSVTGSATVPLTFNIGPSLAPGEYPLTITGTDATNGVQQTTVITLDILPSSNVLPGLPPAWASQDLDQPSTPGQTGFSNGLFQLEASGTGIQNQATADQLQFAFTGLQGNGTIVARLLWVQNASAEAGIMIRNSLDPGDAMAAVYLSNGNVYFAGRSTTGTAAGIYSPGPANQGFPIWLQLTRQGNNVFGATSVDGVNWTQLVDGNGIPLSFNAATNTLVYAGLFGSAGYSGASSSSIFDSVSVNGSSVGGDASGFSLFGSPSSLDVQAGQSGTATAHLLVTPGFSDTVALSLSGLPASVTANFAPANLTGTGDSSLTLSVAANSPIGVFPFDITGTAATTGSTETTMLSLIVLPSSAGGQGTLPSGWANQDVGQPSLAGESFFANGGFLLLGSGAGYSSDQFQYAFTALQGDGSLVARAVAAQNPGSQAGIMVRNSLDPNSAYVELYVSNGTAYFVNRTPYGMPPTQLASVGVVFPVWLELVRQGDNFSAFTSADGDTWTPVSPSDPITAPVPMNANVFAGLTGTSGNIGSLAAVSFDDVNVTGSGSGFSLSSSTTVVAVQPGGTGSTTITALATPGFADSIAFSITGLPDGVTANFSQNSLPGSGNSTLTFSTGAEAAPGNYLLTVTGTDSATSATQTATIDLVVLPVATLPAGGLPAGWSNQDVGQPVFVGQSAFAGGEFEIEGSGTGADVSSSSDQFQYAFTGLQGDGSIVARVFANSSTQAGLMLRNSLDPGAPYLMVSLSGLNILFSGRSANNAEASLLTSGPTSVPVPVWLKLLRQASNFSAYYSWDGSNWTQLGTTVSTQLNGAVFAGLVVSSTDNTQLASTTFDNVSVTSSGTGFSVSASPATVETEPNQTIPVSVTVLGTPGFDDLVNLSVSGLPSGITATFSTPSITGTSSANLTANVSSTALAGFYPLTINGIDASTGITQITTMALVVMPPALGQNNLPAGWANQDVGQASNSGQTLYGDGIFQLIGSGSGAVSSSTTDGFQYAFTGIEGDGAIVARLLAVQNGNSESGVMIRASLDPSSAYVALALFNGNVSFLSRSQFGGSAVVSGTGPSNPQLPVWLKIVRQGNTFSPYTSADGTNWTQLTDGSGNPVSVSVSLNANVYAGLIDAAAVQNGPSNTATFDNVTVTSAGSGFVLSASTSLVMGQPGATPTITIASLGTSGLPGTVGLSVTGLPTDVSASFAPPSIPVSGNSILSLSIGSNAPIGSYAVVITGTDSATSATQQLALTLLISPPSSAPPGGLPAGWTSQDIGQPQVAGETIYNNGLFQLQSQSYGILIPLTTDQFQYAYTAIEGDGTIAARFLTTSDTVSQSGIMIRNSQDPTSPYVMLYVYGGNVYVLSRSSYATQTFLAGSGPVNVQLPIWLELVRQGNNFLPFTSNDGVNWTQLTDGSGHPLAVPVQMNALVYAGLFETSTTLYWELSTADFDNVAVTSTGSAFTLWNSPTVLFTQAGSTPSTTLTAIATPGFSDSINLSIVGLPGGVTSSVAPTSLPGSGQSTVSLAVGAGVAPGSYGLTVTGTDSVTGATQTAPLSLIVPPAADLPPGGLPVNWQNQDIGQPSNPGQSAYSNGLFQLQGSGTGVQNSGSSDQMQYAYTTLAGDGSVIARVLTTQNSLAQSGILIRNSLDPASQDVILYLSNSDPNQNQYTNLSFGARNFDGAQNSISGNNGTVQIPLWLKLIRQGSNFSAYSSRDGLNWLPFTDGYGNPISYSVPMNTLVYAGLMASAGNGAANLTVFDNVSVTGSGAPFSLSVSPDNLQLQPGQTTMVSVTVAGVSGFADSINLSATGLPSGTSAAFSPTSTNGPGSVTLTLSSSLSSPVGTFPLTITGTDATTGTTQSASVSLEFIATSYQYQRAITVSHTQVPNTDQANFPLLVSLTDPLLKSAANGGHVASANGYDLIFTSDAGCSTKLNDEVESWMQPAGSWWPGCRCRC